MMEDFNSYYLFYRKVKGIILHGGHGTRLRPLTHTGPKQLLMIANKPMSKYPFDDLVEAGITDIAIIIGDVYPEKVREYYGDGSQFGAKITYVNQEKPGGIAQAIGLCKDFVGNEKFVVYLGDNILKGGILNYTSHFMQSEADAFILVSKVKDPTRFGVVTIRGDHIEKIVEKPKNPDSDLAVVGIYFLTPTVFSIIENLRPSWRGELEISEALQNLISSGRKVGYGFVTGWWKDTGTPEDILEANRFMLDEICSDVKGIVESEESLQGRIILGKNSIVRRGSIIRGPVVIGENTQIDAGVYIGPYTSIGGNCHIQQGEIESSIIMNNTLIDTKSRVVDSIIASGSKIIDTPESTPHGHRFILGEGSKVFL
jgi:glucose-1-phosphate thymidylyltransferase